jgi:hypothetical protein
MIQHQYIIKWGEPDENGDIYQRGCFKNLDIFDHDEIGLFISDSYADEILNGKDLPNNIVGLINSKTQTGDK